MNHSVKLLFLLFSLAVLSVPSMMDATAASQDEQKKSGIFLNEIAVGSGYVHSSFQGSQNDYFVYPALVRVGFDISSLVGIGGQKSKMQLALEPFVNAIAGDKRGVEAGLSIGVRYFQAIAKSFDLFTEISVAPMFLGIDTVEQGVAGFNFLDQIGLGLQYKLSDCSAFFVGYRFRHLSNANISHPNLGINSDAPVCGISWLF
ncbi:MAG: acyloxyacyl hydrolase [Chlorobiaceae bacterium]